MSVDQVPRLTRIGVGGVVPTGCGTPDSINPGDSFQPNADLDNQTGGETTVLLSWFADGEILATENSVIPQGTTTVTGPPVDYTDLAAMFGVNTSVDITLEIDSGESVACGSLAINESEGCQSDADCGSGKVCRDGSCVSVDGGCQSDADCGSGKVCRDGSCVSVDGGNGGLDARTLALGAGILVAGAGAVRFLQQRGSGGGSGGRARQGPPRI